MAITIYARSVFWEDDGLYDNPDEVRDGSNKDLSLTQARENFKEFNAIDKEFINKVRRPESTELPQNNRSHSR